jgi:hypothetical protein
MWQDVSTAPFNRDIALAVIDDEVHVLIFPCIRTEAGWMNAQTMKRVEVTPTHWRRWPAVTYFSCCG